MEQVDSTELHLSRVKELAGLADNARDVVKEEVILDGPTHQLETKMRLVTSSNENSGGNGSGGGGNVVSVPVSLPIGSMISSTAFNVLGPDHHFKQMLCVDNNGYISGGTVVGNMGADLKTIVIQQHQQPHHQQQHQQQQQHHQQQHQHQQQQHGGNGSHAGIAGVNHGDGSGSNNSHDSLVAGDHTQQSGGGNVSGGVSWSETTHMEIFPIRCKTTNAELYRSKLGSGGRGRCVKFKDKWYTPSEFENVCGRGSSKDWKRSIKYAGKSLQSLIDEGALTPHATNCSCTVCCDDEAASGPVRLFTPYKRRKRNQTDMDVEAGPKRKRNNNNNHNQNNNNNNTNNNNNNSETTQTTTIVDDNNMFLTEDNVVSKDEPWPTLNDSLDTPTELVDQSQMQVHPYDRETFVVNINDPGSLALLDTSQAMKSLENVYCTMMKATNDFKRIMNDIKSVYERKIEILQKERDAAVAAMRVQVHTDIDDPNISGSLHGNEIISAKKCANCDREALAECSLCRKTPYCSEFCQRKDWHSHQVVCSRSPQAATQQIMLLVDEQP